MTNPINHNFRPCGDCSACCQGFLQANIYGAEMGNGKPCAFYMNKCLIYDTRPSTCSNYYCAWSQGLFPEWMKPNKSKVLISVQTWSKGQYLLASAMAKDFNQECIDEINKFSDAESAPAVFIMGDKISIKGSDEFKEEYFKTKRIPLA